MGQVIKLHESPQLLPRQPTTKRPFRIWNAREKKHEIGRNYRHVQHAKNGALVLAYEGKPKDAFEVYDVTNGRLIAQFVRTPTSITRIQETK